MPQAFEPMLQRLQQTGMPQVSQQLCLLSREQLYTAALGAMLRHNLGCMAQAVAPLPCRWTSARPTSTPVVWDCLLTSTHTPPSQVWPQPIAASWFKVSIKATPSCWALSVDEAFRPALAQQCHADCYSPCTLLSAHVQAPSPLSPWLATQSWSSGRRLPAGPCWCQLAPCWS